MYNKYFQESTVWYRQDQYVMTREKRQKKSGLRILKTKGSYKCKGYRQRAKKSRNKFAAGQSSLQKSEVIKKQKKHQNH